MNRPRAHSRDAILYSLSTALLLCALLTQSGRTQSLESQVDLLGGRLRLEQPGSLAAAPAGDRFAISDLAADRIVVIDLDAAILWMTGSQTYLGSPRAVCFDHHNNVLFVQDGRQLILRVTEQDPARIDTIADLATVLPPKGRIDQLLALRKGGYLALSISEGIVRRLDDAFQVTGEFVPSGSGKGKVLVPTSIAEADDGRIVITDRKNLAVQCFSHDGAFLYSGGWNQVELQRGWSAIASTVDSRGMVWIADDTNSRFRLFDGAGTEIASLAFTSPLFRPTAMTGTSDNRVLVLEQNGTLVFYNLE